MFAKYRGESSLYSQLLTVAIADLADPQTDDVLRGFKDRDASGMSGKAKAMKKNLRIIYIAESAIPSRSANSMQVMRMCQAFAQQGVDIELVVPWQPQKLFTQPKAFFDLHSYYGTRPLFPIRFLANPIPPIPHRVLAPLREKIFLYMARRFMLGIKEGLVYTRSLNLAADLAQRGIPVAVECHEYEFFVNRGDLENLRKVVNSPFLKLIVVISANLKRLYIEFGLPEAKILVAHDGVDAKLFDCECRVSPISKLDLGISDDGPVVCYAGKMSNDRGIELLIEAARILNRSYFVLLGGTLKEIGRLRQQIEQNDIANIRLVGFVPPAKVPRYLCGADILVAPYTTKIPTLHVASPLKIFEYMATGKPIVISDLPTIREVVKDGYDAILVEPDSIESLVMGLKRALTPEARQIGINARQTVQRYTWQARARYILDALEAE